MKVERSLLTGPVFLSASTPQEKPQNLALSEWDEEEGEDRVKVVRAGRGEQQIGVSGPLSILEVFRIIPSR